MIFGVQFPTSPSAVLSFFEKFREITHTLKKSIVTTSERQWIHCHSFFSLKCFIYYKSNFIVITSGDNESIVITSGDNEFHPGRYVKFYFEHHCCTYMTMLLLSDTLVDNEIISLVHS